MRNFILFIAAIGLALWSLLCWAAYGLLGLAGGLAASGAVFVPLPPELVIWMAGLIGGAGGVFVWIAWFIGAATVAAVTMILLALVGRPERRAAEPRARYSNQSEPLGSARRPERGETRSAEEIVARALGKPRS